MNKPGPFDQAIEFVLPSSLFDTVLGLNDKGSYFEDKVSIKRRKKAHYGQQVIASTDHGTLKRIVAEMRFWLEPGRSTLPNVRRALLHHADKLERLAG